MNIRCPFIYICNEKIDYHSYKKFCDSPDYNYTNCEVFKKLAEEKKRPYKWMLIEMGGIGNESNTEIQSN